MSSMIVTLEGKVRYVVNEIAKDIIEIDAILDHVGMTKEEYLTLSTTRQFKDALSVAMTEWQSASNTPKRVKLKAAAIAEELILAVFKSTVGETLSAQTKTLEVISKIAGLGALEPAVNANGGVMGNTFNLQINWSANSGENRTESFQIGSPVLDEGYSQELSDESEGGEDDSLTSTSNSSISPTDISPVFGEDFDEL